ncbi:MAG: amidohydrolase, partial [Bacteroidales bacterium]|nr:amidohydrolase [Bacteroidales bacterium]
MKKSLLPLLSLMLSCSTAMAQPAIDVHCHNILPEFRALLERHGAALEETFPLPDWDIDAHLAFMEAAGIQTSLLSMPAPQPYFGDAEECRKTVRLYNEACAKLKAGYPGKFLFCAALPLPDVEAAMAEAIYALDTLGADGIKLATNSRGQYVGDAALDPLMEVLNRRQAVIILHPHKPSPVNDSIIATAPLAVYEYPSETTRAVINLIAKNVPARYANFRIVVPHCGSFLPLAIPRMKAILPVMQAKGYMQPVDWEANLAHLYYDLAGGATPEVVKSLLTLTTPDHLLYGSDYPYQPAGVLTENLKRLRAWLATDSALAPHAEAILNANARALCGGPA